MMVASAAPIALPVVEAEGVNPGFCGSSAMTSLPVFYAYATATVNIGTPGAASGGVPNAGAVTGADNPDATGGVCVSIIEAV